MWNGVTRPWLHFDCLIILYYKICFLYMLSTSRIFLSVNIAYFLFSLSLHKAKAGMFQVLVAECVFFLCWSKGEESWFVQEEGVTNIVWVELMWVCERDIYYFSSLFSCFSWPYYLLFISPDTASSQVSTRSMGVISISSLVTFSVGDGG